MQIRSPPFWLMMVSIAMAVLPVWRSPMINSRWPRPMGIMPSMALIPVCIGSFTGLGLIHPGGAALDGVERVGENRATAVNRLAEAVHHASDHGVAHRHRHDAAGALDH